GKWGRWGGLMSPLVVNVSMLVYFLQRGLTQKIGIALAGLGKLDKLLRDNAVGETVGKPERYASHFERDSQNQLGFGIGIELVQIRSDRHANPQGTRCAACAPVEQTGFVGGVQIKPRCRPILARTSAR